LFFGRDAEAADDRAATDAADFRSISRGEISSPRPRAIGLSASRAIEGIRKESIGRIRSFANSSAM